MADTKNYTGRFSPSPTGKLHMGSLRTALISYFTSKSFVLRVEDTDVKRSTKESEVEIIDTFKWLGIKPDGEVVRQSQQEASGAYKGMVDALIAHGYAYRCACSIDELREMKTQQIKNKERRLGYNGKCRDSHNGSGVVRLNTRKIGEERGDKFFVFEDDVFNTRRVDFRDVPDAVLLRSNGTATYILANTIDDMQAGVNYVARGADIITQTATQMALREAIHLSTGIPNPEVQYSHLPLILGSKNEKLSKRNPDTKSILEYKAKGFTKEAIVQFVLSLGNKSIPTNRALHMGEMKSLYDVKKLRRNDTGFLEHKLLHLNGLHLKRMDASTAHQMITDLYGVSLDIKLISGFKERTQTLLELKNRCEEFTALVSAKPEGLKKLNDDSFSIEACKEFRKTVLGGVRTPPLKELL